MLTLELTQGQVATIDDVDADLAAINWHAHKRGKTFYARRNLPRGDGKRLFDKLHQVIARRMGIVGAPDHIDRDGLNNRRNNLRPDPNGRNNANHGKRADNTSGFKGVTLDRARGKWMVRIQVDSKSHYLGLFDDKIDAAKAYDDAALELHGEFAVLNFPEIQC